jgi:chromosome segregation ATPase
MNQPPTLERRADGLADQLNQLASRTTRGVAELRAQSTSILDDLAAWRSHLEQFRVDAELARMDARDELDRAHATLYAQFEAIHRRLADARDDAAATWKELREGLDEAFADLRRASEPDGRGRTSS